MEQRQLTIVVHLEDDGEQWAEVPELPGCFAAGADRDELKESLREALSLYLFNDPDRVRGLDLTLPDPKEHVEVEKARLIAV